MSDNYLLHDWTIEGCWRKPPSPIFDQETWYFLRDAYRRAVHPENSSISFEKKSGMKVPYEVRLSPGKGRGLFTTEKIKKDVTIWETTMRGKFPDEISWRRYLSSIPYELACESIVWSYVWRRDENDEKAVYIDLDDGALMNHYNEGKEMNAIQTPEGFFVTTRDIEEGEEIIISYDGYSSDIDWYEAIENKAWIEGYEASSDSTEDSIESDMSHEEITKISTEVRNSTQEESSSNDGEQISSTSSEENELTEEKAEPDKALSDSDNYLLHHWSIEGCWRKPPSPIFDQETWYFLRDAYRRAVYPENSSISSEKKSGMKVPYEVRLIPGKGRGLFTTEKIKKDVTIWENTMRGKFPDEISWRRYLSSIPYDLACDSFMWCYAWGRDENDEKALHIELDDGALMNSAEDSEGINAIETPEGFFKTTRDIEEGEEILDSYYGLTSDIDWYRAMKNKAWIEGYEASSDSTEDSIESDMSHEEITKISTEVRNSTQEESSSNDGQQISSKSSDENELDLTGSESESGDGLLTLNEGAGILRTTTGLRTNPINETLNGSGGAAEYGQQHDWSMLLFSIFPFIFMIICYFCKNGRHRYACPVRCRKKKEQIE